MKNAKNILSIFVIIFVVASVFFLQNNLNSLVVKGRGALQGLGRASSAILTTINEGKSLTPGPLIIFKKPVDATGKSSITVSGIIAETNTARALNNLPPLSEKNMLDLSAQTKVDDMFVHQYFEHTSPEGKTVATFVSSSGYEYVLIGENLALGNFLSSKDVVDAWMASPGHRANILNTRFTNIGVGVTEGFYKGEKVWIAVQHFGLPRNACPTVDDSLKVVIDANQIQINLDSAKLAELKKKIDEEGSTQNKEYRVTVNEYNILVEKYNVLVSDTKQKVDEYNQQIRALNACIPQIPAGGAVERPSA